MCAINHVQTTAGSTGFFLGFMCPFPFPSEDWLPPCDSHPSFCSVCVHRPTSHRSWGILRITANPAQTRLYWDSMQWGLCLYEWMLLYLVSTLYLLSSKQWWAVYTSVSIDYMYVNMKNQITKKHVYSCTCKSKRIRPDKDTYIVLSTLSGQILQWHVCVQYYNNPKSQIYTNFLKYLFI